MLNFKKFLMKNFKMTDRKIKLFLGIKIERNNDTLTLDQSIYLKAILDKFNMTECKPVKTPINMKIDYEKLNSDEDSGAPCRQLIGSLMYVMLCTRPDLCVTINILSRYQSKNNAELWTNLKRVLRYIKGSINLKLIYKRSNPDAEILVGYVDSDWGGHEDDRKSTSGYLFQAYKNCTVSWNSRRQNTVAASSTEAEYIALFEGVREAIWLKSLFESISIKMVKPITIFEDNRLYKYSK
jgi:hypothetical protein